MKEISVDGVVACNGVVIPWSTLDPGIVEVVKQLQRMGLNTTDSGDGRHKAQQQDPDGSPSWEEGSYSDLPHVIIVPEEGELVSTAKLICEWILSEDMGEDVQVDGVFQMISSGFFAGLLLHGDSLYGWTPDRPYGADGLRINAESSNGSTAENREEK